MEPSQNGTVRFVYRRVAPDEVFMGLELKIGTSISIK